MDVVRRASMLVTAGTLGLAIMLGSVPSRPALSANAVTRMRVGADYFDSTIVIARFARPRGARGDALTIALGYLERERLGLGSPFRLIDAALQDPRMDPWMTDRVTWALLARLRRGDAYVIDPAALDGIGASGASGAAHLALIERAVADGDDPRVGERAVRLAYQIAASQGRVTADGVAIAIRAAAMVRDRVIAESDARALLAAASLRHADVMRLLSEWRAARAFRVEQPALVPLSAEARMRAMQMAPALVRALDTLDRVATAPPRGASHSLLGAHFAERLAVLGAAQPPLAQLIVPLRGDSGIDAFNEEVLAASLARQESRRAGLDAAVALRTMNQSDPWFVGDGGPDVGDLSAEFGLSNVSFARGVRPEWRPYFLRELATSLRDMRSVFPALSYDGLSVAFGTSPLTDSALAMHDPRTRTVRLTVVSSAGTLAHELAHDLDWQTSRRLFASAGGYSTDRAATEKRGALAVSVSGLGASHTRDRPTEVFARSADWFVATSLALDGRSNGFLTAVQDALLPGYAAGSPAATGTSGAASLTAALDQMTYVSDSSRAAFEAVWSDSRIVDPSLLVQRVLAVPLSYRGLVGKQFSLPMLEPAEVLCFARATDEDRATGQLVLLAIDARAHALAARRGRYRGALDTARLESQLRMAIAQALRGSFANEGIVPVASAPFSGCR